MVESQRYLLHGLLVDVLLEDVGLALDGVSLQRLQDLLWRDEAVFGLQQGHVQFVGLQHRDHLISGLGGGEEVNVEKPESRHDTKFHSSKDLDSTLVTVRLPAVLPPAGSAER